MVVSPLLIQNLSRNTIVNKIIVVGLGLVVVFGGFASYYGYKDITKEDLKYFSATPINWETKDSGRIDFYFQVKEYPAKLSVWSVPYSKMNQNRFREAVKNEETLEFGIKEKDYPMINLSSKSIDVFEINKDILNLSEVNASLRSNAEVGKYLAFIFLALIPLYLFLVRFYKG